MRVARGLRGSCGPGCYGGLRGRVDQLGTERLDSSAPSAADRVRLERRGDRV